MENTQVFVFSIETTWNGDPVNHSPVQLKVSSENETSVRVDVVGPLFNDPGPPPVTSGSPCPELWEYEVVEIFFLGKEDKYLEVELCPHGQHLVLFLSGTRNIVKAHELGAEASLGTEIVIFWAKHTIQAMALEKETLQNNADKLDLNYTAEINDATKTWKGTAFIPLDYFPPEVTKINAYAIHGSGDGRQYEALYPASKDFHTPDFHRLQFFKDFDFKALFPESWIQPESVHWTRA